MSYPDFFNAKNSIKLFGLNDELNFLSSLYEQNKLPRVILFSGIKGLGKSTLINHFLFSIFDEKYDKNNMSIGTSSKFYNQFKENIFSNIIYVSGSDFLSIKIDDIRNLKIKIFQSSIMKKDRFIIFDDVELFNINSLNALLKIIEEPNKNNYFFLINNKSKTLLDTIKSRSLEIKIFLNEKKRVDIIESLIESFKLDLALDPKKSRLSPGNFVKFNQIFLENDLKIEGNFMDSLTKVLNLHKKSKDILFVNLAFFLVDHYLIKLKNGKIFNNEKIYEIKNFIFYYLNNLFKYNLNLTSFLNQIENKLSHE